MRNPTARLTALLLAGLAALPAGLPVSAQTVAPASGQPTVTSVSEASVRLEAGGRPVTLTLLGTDLDQLQSAAVVLGGQPAAGLTAQLGAPAKTSRPVTFTAQAAAKPGRDYRLQLTGGKQPVTPAVAIEVAAPPPPPAVAKIEPPKTPPPPPTGARTEPLKVAPEPLKALVPAAPAPAAPLKSAEVVTKIAPTTPAAAAPAAPLVSRVAPPFVRPILEPSITRVVPSTVRLQAGGGSVTLTLFGQELDRLTSVSVQMGTAAAPGVSARLGPPAKTSRTLTLTAQATALPSTAYRLQAVGARLPLALAASIEVFWPLTMARPLVVLPAAPVLSRVERTPDGYALVGRGFGTDRSRLQVFEGNAQIGTIVSLANDRIVVRSQPSGTTQHRVVVGGLPSATLSFTHPVAARVIGSVGMSSDELSKMFQSPRIFGLTGGAPAAPGAAPARSPSLGAPRLAPTPGLAPSTGAGAPRVAGPAAPGAPAASGGPSSPGASGLRAAPSSAAAPSPGAALRSVTTGELSMSGIGE